jgi:hypothetical protein
MMLIVPESCFRAPTANGLSTNVDAWNLMSIATLCFVAAVLAAATEVSATAVAIATSTA